MIRRLGPVMIHTASNLGGIPRPLVDVGLYPQGEFFADREPTTIALTFAVGDRGADPILAFEVSFGVPLTLGESHWATP